MMRVCLTLLGSYQHRYPQDTIVVGAGNRYPFSFVGELSAPCQRSLLTSTYSAPCQRSLLTSTYSSSLSVVKACLPWLVLGEVEVDDGYYCQKAIMFKTDPRLGPTIGLPAAWNTEHMYSLLGVCLGDVNDAEGEPDFWNTTWDGLRPHRFTERFIDRMFRDATSIHGAGGAIIGWATEA